MASKKKLRPAGKNSHKQEHKGEAWDGPADVKEAQEVMLRLRAQRGALSALAAKIGLTAQAVHQWNVVPLERVLEVEKALGIPRQQLRPDVFAAK